MLRIRVLGGLAVSLDSDPLPLPATRRARSLLGYLAVHPGSQPRGLLAAQFWPDVPEESARTSLRGALSELRRCLGPAAACLRATREAVELDGDLWVDVRALRDLAARGQPEQAARLARGRLLPGLDDEWVAHCREEHDLEVRTLASRAAACAEADGRLDDAVAHARHRARLDPLSEAAGREHIRLLAAAGDRAAAVEAGRDLVARLRSDLGVEPDPETDRLLAGLRAPPSAPRSASGQEASGPVPLEVPVPSLGGDEAVVGRSTVLDEVRRARREGPRVVLLSGEAGIGKTAAALTACREAAVDGALVLVGRCDEEGVVPYAPWVDALGLLARVLDEAQLRELAQDDALVRLMPQLRRYAGASATTDAEADTQRWRLFEAVCALLVRVAGPRPLVILLDDVHWADQSTLLLLRHLLRTRQPLSLTVVMTARDADAPADAALPTTLAQLRRDEPVLQVDLGGLDEHAVAELVRRRRGDGVAPDVVRALFQETQGNPFFVEEILRGTPRLGQPAGDETSFGVPEGVRDVVGLRLVALDDTVRQVLDLAAVVGHEFDMGVVRAALGWGPDDVVVALDAAVDAQLVDERGVGSYSFRHALTRSVILESRSRTRRALTHLQVARSMEDLGWARRPGGAATLAHHYLESQEPSCRERALDCLTDAHDQAMDQCAYEDAARTAARRLAVLRTDSGPDRIVAALAVLGNAQLRAGDHEAARATYGELAEIARERRNGTLLGEAALGFAGPPFRNFGRVDVDDIAILEEALAGLGDANPALRSQLEARLAVALYSARQPDRMLSLTASALQGARRTGDPSVLAAALEARLWATWRPDAVEERLATAEELLAEAEAAGLPDVGVVARRWRVTALVEAGRMDEAWVECARHAESANRLRLPYEQLYVAVFTAMRALLEGRLDDVEVASQQVASFSELRGGADALQFGGVHALTLAQIHGDLAPMADALAFFVAAYPDLPGWRGALAYVLVATGRRDEAAEQVDALWPPSETLPFDANWLPAHYFLAWAVIGLEDARRARQLYDALSPWASRPVVLGAAGAVWGTTSLVLAALADLLGDDAAADQHRREADAEARRIGAIAGFEPLVEQAVRSRDRASH